MCGLHQFIYLFFKGYLFVFFLDRGEGREREGEKHQSIVAIRVPILGTWLATQMCPDWELNRQRFGSQAGTLSTEPHQPGL